VSEADDTQAEIDRISGNLTAIEEKSEIDKIEAKVQILIDKLQQAEADAKASEMMLRQVCDERDEAAKEVVALRELLRDCPLFHEINEQRVGVVFPSTLEEGGMKFQQDGIRWIERAKEEAAVRCTGPRN